MPYVTQDTQKPTILVVDDDAELLKVTARVLKLHGYTVHTADRCTQAIELVEQLDDAVDLLLTDMQMPEMDGCELAVRLADKHPDLRILYTSGFPQQVMDGKSNGACVPANFIEKPYAMSDLARRVQEILIAPQPAH
jgi:two-component system cell cycle sensor histidine kinase/response regulator CckA